METVLDLASVSSEDSFGGPVDRNSKCHLIKTLEFLQDEIFCALGTKSGKPVEWCTLRRRLLMDLATIAYHRYGYKVPELIGTDLLSLDAFADDFMWCLKGPPTPTVLSCGLTVINPSRYNGWFLENQKLKESPFASRLPFNNWKQQFWKYVMGQSKLSSVLRLRLVCTTWNEYVITCDEFWNQVLHSFDIDPGRKCQACDHYVTGTSLFCCSSCKSNAVSSTPKAKFDVQHCGACLPLGTTYKASYWFGMALNECILRWTSKKKKNNRETMVGLRKSTKIVNEFDVRMQEMKRARDDEYEELLRQQRIIDTRNTFIMEATLFREKHGLKKSLKVTKRTKRSGPTDEDDST